MQSDLAIEGTIDVWAILDMKGGEKLNLSTNFNLYLHISYS